MERAVTNYIDSESRNDDKTFHWIDGEPTWA
jgi:hypothetical protein